MDPTKWSKRVGTVFNTGPRIGIGKTLWQPRDRTLSQLSQDFHRPRSHVCLDGASGVGKTSLALTFLVRERIRHCAIQLTHGMEWHDFCRQLIRSPSNKELSVYGDFQFGTDETGLLPKCNLRIGLGVKGRKSDDIDLVEKMAHSWGEHEVARHLAEEDVALLVDDLDRASDALVMRISDLCKLLIQSYVSENAKLLIVGTGNAYYRVYIANDALDKRLNQVSLGGFRHDYESWGFLTEGFEALGLKHPGHLPDRRTKNEAECMEAVYRAADGLPKSLNQLGYEIATHVLWGDTVDTHDVVEQSEKMCQENWEQYEHMPKFREILRYLQKNHVAIEVTKALYSTGITRVHTVDQIMFTVMKALSGSRLATERDDVVRAIDGLVDARLLVRTGKSGETILVDEPTHAHTLGVVMRDPTRFKSIGELLDPKQLTLAFPRQTSDIECE